MDEDNRQSILFVCSECVPFSSGSGLADMCYALPKYLGKDENFDVRVVLPLYSTISDRWKNEMTPVGERTVELTWRKNYCGVYELDYSGIKYYFIDNKQYFDRPEIYGYSDDVERFSFFSMAVLEIMPIINFFPDIVHANDWQSGMVCTFLKVLEWKNPKYEHIKTVLNIHGLDFQGRTDFGVVKEMLGIDEKFGYLFDYFGGANLLKASILCADKVVTVSETYKQEILETDLGCGLQDVLGQAKYKLEGIINGIDYEFYDTEKDEDIAYNFNASSLENRLKNKLELQKFLELEEAEDVPLYAFIGFMSSRKGMTLILQILDKFVTEKQVQFVALGTPSEETKAQLEELSGKFKGKIKIVFGHNRKLAKQIYSGADFLLNVSSSEPCGLCPMIANRYGTLPIVYQTGGLKDNFSDFKYLGGNAYVLKNYDANSLYDLLERTLHDYQNEEKMKNYILSGMEQNFDIAECAEKYKKLYEDM